MMRAHDRTVQSRPMLQRSVAGNGVVSYVSPLLRECGVPHAFSTRLGGVSAGPFASLNLGNPNGCPVQDEPANINTNYQRLLQAVGCASHRLLRVHQVHGRAVVVVDNGFCNSAQADALVSRQPNAVVSVRVADCAPILIASSDGRTVAAVHAGWRGVVANVLGAAIDAMLRTDAHLRPADLVLAIGPCISLEAMEVGPEVLAEFEQAFGPGAPIRRRGDGKGHVDMRAALRLAALQAGLPSGQIDSRDLCTHLREDEFFSHRREGGVTGRMAALIAPRD